MNNKFKNIFSSKYFWILNVLILLIIYLLLINLFQYTFLCGHDYYFPYFKHLEPRLPSQTGGFLFVNFLPQVFNQNPNDFKSIGVGGLILFPLIYLSIYLIFSKGFFLSLAEKINIFKIKEFLFIIPLTFIFLIIPFPNEFNYQDSIIINDTIEFSEYFFVYLLIFFYYTAFYRLIIYDKSVTKSQTITLTVLSFFIGAWNEIIHINMALCIFFFLIFLLISGQKELIWQKKKILISMFCAFAAGMLCYYFFRNYTSIYHYNISEHLFSNFSQIKEFNKHYFNAIFTKNTACYIPIIILSSILFFKRNENKNIKNILAYSFSIITALIITNYLMILCQGFYIDIFYLFEKPNVLALNCNYLEFVIIILLGTLYYQYKDKIKYLFVFMLILLIPFIGFFINFRNTVNKIDYYNKRIAKDIEQRCVIYNYLGETAIIPETYKKFWFSEETFKIGFQNPNFKLMNNQYYAGKYYFAPYIDYFKTTYKENLIGLKYLPDKKANTEFIKRLLLLDETFLLKNEKSISYNYIYKKYKNKKLTLENIHNSDKIDLSKNILKAQAYIYLQNNNLEEAEKLYKKYLETYNNNDVDVYLNLIKIYEKQNKINEVEKAYIKLSEIEKSNIIFYYELMKIYFYNYQDYQKALQICDKIMFEVVSTSTYAMYLNKAIILIKLGRDKEAADAIRQAEIINQSLSKKNRRIDINKLENSDIVFPEISDP